MPNQWAKIVKAVNPANAGMLVAIEKGPPRTRPTKDCTSNTIADDLVYELLGSSPHGPLGPFYNPGERIAIQADRVELLGPDECRALDEKYGLTGEGDAG